MFRGIRADGFEPFGDFELAFPPVEKKPEDLAEVHLFTGVNGTGKTRILSLLAALLGNPEPLKKRLRGVEKPILFFVTENFPLQDNLQRWTDRFTAGNKNASWTQVSGVHPWTERVAAFAYSGIAYVADSPIAVLADVPKPERADCLSFTRPEHDSGRLLQAIANLKIQAAMDSMNQSSPTHGKSRAVRIVQALESTISEVTGLHFSFVVTSYPKAALEVSWGAVVLAFNTLPDGLRSIIGWLAHSVVMMDVWLQGKKDPFQEEAVFLLDEIEGALHPAWQRRILPAFQKLFPKAQIFIATHSPFLISSLNHGWIHPLAMDTKGKVTLKQPVPASEGDSYVSVLEEIMNVTEWYDPETESLLSEFRKERDAAYHGNSQASIHARELAAKIGGRSMELDYMMGRELRQMDRQLSEHH